ncbi:hypothetical protein EDC21_104172 [Thermohydrogenium kirishiense]|nr:hypothetical protein EDC21_104172 [Thermohydrogenium kirishiense]
MIFTNKKIIDYTLFYYAIYLILGNLLRIINIPFFKNNLLVTEFLLYLFALLSFFIFNLSNNKYKIKIPIELFFIILIYFISYFLGSLYHGYFLINAFMYSLRLILLILSSIVIGTFFYFKKYEIKKVIDFYIFVFFIYTIIAWVIFIAYPDSVKLWTKLGQFGIIFNGDPHVRRLLGAYFDPNFFGNIIIFPMLLSLYSYYRYNRRYIIYFLFFLLSIIYTFSRSSLFGFIISLAIIAIIMCISFIYKKYLNKKTIYLGIVIAILSIIFVMFNYNEFERLVMRFANIMNDASAAHRFRDIYLGINTLYKSFYILLFGIGYNYVQNDLRLSLTSLDSSVLNTLISLGTLGTIIVFVLIINYLRKIYRNLDEKYHGLYLYIVSYLISSIIMSNFNNLLYYQFYIMTILPFLIFLYKQKDVD